MTVMPEKYNIDTAIQQPHSLSKAERPSEFAICALCVHNVAAGPAHVSIALLSYIQPTASVG